MNITYMFTVSKGKGANTFQGNNSAMPNLKDDPGFLMADNLINSRSVY